MKKPNMFVMMKQVEKQLQDYKALLSFLAENINRVELGDYSKDLFYSCVKTYFDGLGGDAA